MTTSASFVTLIAVACLVLTEAQEKYFCDGEGRRTFDLSGCKKFKVSDNKHPETWTPFENALRIGMSEGKGLPTQIQMVSTDPDIDFKTSWKPDHLYKKGKMLSIVQEWVGDKDEDSWRCIKIRDEFDMTFFTIDVAEDGTVRPTMLCKFEDKSQMMAFCTMETRSSFCDPPKEETEKDKDSDTPTDPTQEQDTAGKDTSTDTAADPARDGPKDTSADPATQKSEGTDANGPSSDPAGPKKKGMGSGLLIGIAVIVVVAGVSGAAVWYRRRMSVNTAPLLDNA
uniref:Uncharacterized protein n=1 Tax=Chromera velia CCMP2878 TaxID=1169474 RepID=A0A0G4IDA3_9ALVE|mmetsp:Transcript_17059/g.34609  ORF Transcript_17059/g.34609 Transcript_17059/m.34609 type:complete len:283 (+) Transcript_17059:38-886(+)|eukprot:Cvel_116.t1-p1 / transcript=Cvel_116.t1 / gene=Cvel_116 / organism=Chromera_velia_CCMP2878 / gene_product=hypothetical protein / transcript_product=hypothetical protein / location=Cvel_scaffold8:193601-194446(-) / protein_length=282 / sequence_SO=supercontig / SO=protein_coding / is_pseudo=false